MQATMMLCDFAEATNGKLYVIGGGWTVWLDEHRPLDCSVALLVQLSSAEAGRQQKILLRLLDNRGRLVRNPDGEPAVRIKGAFSAASVPSTLRGETITSPTALRVQGVKLEPGRYRFDLSINGEKVATSPFRVGNPKRAS